MCVYVCMHCVYLREQINAHFTELCQGGYFEKYVPYQLLCFKGWVVGGGGGGDWGISLHVASLCSHCGPSFFSLSETYV